MPHYNIKKVFTELEFDLLRLSFARFAKDKDIDLTEMFNKFNKCDVDVVISFSEIMLISQSLMHLLWINTQNNVPNLEIWQKSVFSLLTGIDLCKSPAIIH